MYVITREADEVDTLLRKADAAALAAGLSMPVYAMGIRDALRWLFGQTEDNPGDEMADPEPAEETV